MSRTSLRNVSDLTRLVQILENEGAVALEGERPASMGDAALLMATDGYGKGKVEGEGVDDRRVVIRTSDTIESFLFDTDPDPAALYEETRRHLEEISQRRGLGHCD